MIPPTTSPMVTATMLTVIDTRAACTTRESWSRPRASAPSGCSAENPAKRSITFGRLGSGGGSRGAERGGDPAQGVGAQRVLRGEPGEAVDHVRPVGIGERQPGGEQGAEDDRGQPGHRQPEGNALLAADAPEPPAAPGLRPGARGGGDDVEGRFVVDAETEYAVSGVVKWLQRCHSGSSGRGTCRGCRR